MADRDTKRLLNPMLRESKGKRHHLHAESLDRLAKDIGQLPVVTSHELATIFLKEARRIREILR